MASLKKYKTNRNAASRTIVVFFIGHSLKNVEPIGLKDLVVRVSIFGIVAQCWYVLPFYSLAWQCAALMRRCTMLECSPFLLVSVTMCWSNRICFFMLEFSPFLLVGLKMCWSNSICCFILGSSFFSKGTVPPCWSTVFSLSIGRHGNVLGPIGFAALC